jgi:hypothetical protein
VPASRPEISRETNSDAPAIFGPGRAPLNYGLLYHHVHK